MARALYEVLGVSEDATLEEIKKAYRKRVKECHPDHHGEEKQAEFVAVSKAYAVLSDPEKRKRYDVSGVEEEAPKPTRDETVVMLLLQEYSDAFKQDLHNPYADYTAAVGRVLIEKKNVGVRQHDDLLRVYCRLVQIRKRIKRKGGDNFVARQITNDLKGIKTSLKTIRENIDILEKAQIMNQDFNYESESFEPMSGTTANNTLSRNGSWVIHKF